MVGSYHFRSLHGFGKWVSPTSEEYHEPVKYCVTVGSFVVNEVQLVPGDKPFEKSKEETVDHKDGTEYGTSHRA